MPASSSEHLAAENLTSAAEDSSPSSVRSDEASHRVARRIRQGILSGEFPPGTRIRQEVIAERFGSSRVPVREALHILEDEGLVAVVANSGCWVRTPTMSECDETYRMREHLEPLLLHYAAPILSPDDLEHLGTLAAAMESTKTVQELLDLDREFHLGLSAQTRTAQLRDTVVKLWNTSQPYRRAYAASMSATARRRTLDEHHSIVRALQDADTVAAARLLTAHIRRTRRNLSKHPDLITARCSDADTTHGRLMYAMQEI